MGSRHRDQKIVSSVPCPLCRAQRGQPCRNPTPHDDRRGPEDRRPQPRHPHLERRDAWREAHPEEERLDEQDRVQRPTVHLDGGAGGPACWRPTARHVTADETAVTCEDCRAARPRGRTPTADALARELAGRIADAHDRLRADVERLAAEALRDYLDTGASPADGLRAILDRVRRDPLEDL